ncbi:hypothetical protein Aperf_G00000108816 [Anoplocephala perfoliata]
MVRHYQPDSEISSNAGSCALIRLTLTAHDREESGLISEMFFRKSRPTSDLCTEEKEVHVVALSGPRLPHFASYRDLQFLEGNADLTEPRTSVGNGRALNRDGGRRPLDGSDAARSHSQSGQEGRSSPRNHLIVPPISNFNGRSHTHSNSSQESMEYSETSSRKPPEPLQGFITKNRMRPMKGWHELLPLLLLCLRLFFRLGGHTLRHLLSFMELLLSSRAVFQGFGSGSGKNDNIVIPVRSVLNYLAKFTFRARFFSLKDGCLSYAKNQSILIRGKNTTQIDLANTVVKYEIEKLQIDIDTSAFVYHLKFEDPKIFRRWMAGFKEHRSYDQYQMALKSTGRLGISQPASGNASSSSGDGVRPTGSCTSLPTTPEGPTGEMRPNSLSLHPVHSTSQLRTLKQSYKLSGERVEALENQVRKLESLYLDLEKAQSELMDSYIPENDTTDTENSSPSRSLFFSPMPFGSSEVGSTSFKPQHSRISSISSMNSMCTAVQATPTLIYDPQGNRLRSPRNVILTAANFGDQARKFIEEANAAAKNRIRVCLDFVPDCSGSSDHPCKCDVSYLERKNPTPSTSPSHGGNVSLQILASVQQAQGYLNSTPNNERHSSLNTNSQPRNSLTDRTDTDSDLATSEGSPSDDMPVLNESNMNTLPDMKGAELKTPEHVAGRRTALPAQQSTPTALSLLALLKNNLGREMSKLKLPALLNEPLSVLQNLCEEMEYSHLLDTAVEMKDKFQRMLYVVTFIITGFTCRAYRKATKSFTPLLGETFECLRPEKHWRFLAEQVSLNPPVSAAHCESNLWTFDEEFYARYKFLGKSLEVTTNGGCQLHFPKWRETYTWSTATTSLTNLATPTARLLNQNSDMTVWCSNGVTGSIRFGKLSSKKPNATRNVLGTVKPLDSSESPRTVYGQWDKVLASRDENNEDRCIWRAYPMPSNAELFYGFTQFAIELNEPAAPDAISSGRLPITDTRRRPDIRLLELGRVEDAEAENKRLEDDQRRRLRSLVSRDGDGSNAWKPLWFIRKPKPVNSLENGSSYEFNSAYWRYRESGGFKNLNLPVLW